MLHSIEHFFPQAIDRYPVIIFYDPHGTRIRTSDIDHVRSCTRLRLIFERVILFDLISNRAETIDRISREVPSDDQRPIGYRFKCQFWSHTVFHHPAVKNNYHFIMRFDDDSSFLQPFSYDLFQYAFENRLDYVYRALEPNDQAKGTNAFLRDQIETSRRTCKHFCFPFSSTQMLHTGFFISSLRIWYTSPVEQLFDHLLANDTILTESLDDRTIHPVVLTLTSHVNRVRLVPFAYAHNVHLYVENSEQAERRVELLVNRTSSNCRQLVVIDPASKHLKYIEMK